MSRPEDCPFCDPGEIGWRLIHEDEKVLSFLSNPRIVRGNALVVPRRHIEPPEPMTDQEMIAVFSETERLRSVMLGRLAFLGVDVFQKTRPQVAQGHNGTKVNHLHFHVLPSYPGTELYDTGVIWTPDRFSPLTREEAAELIPLLRKEAA